MAQLLHLESASPDLEISLYINSPGGSYSTLTAIYDTMQYIQPPAQYLADHRPQQGLGPLLAFPRADHGRTSHRGCLPGCADDPPYGPGSANRSQSPLAREVFSQLA
jgi:hypothetical protein